MGLPNLYICHTAYQVLVEMVRAMEDTVAPDLILSSVIPNTEELAGRLSATGLFRCVRVFDENACGSAIQPGFLRTLLLQRIMGRRNVEKYYGFSIDPKAYAAIYIHNDWSVLGRYLQDLKAPYVLCEDTMASTCRPSHPIIDEQRAQPHFRLRQKLGYGYLYWGDYKRVSAVETECAAKTNLFPQKLREDSKTDRFHRLTEAQKGLIRQVFLTQPLPEKAEGAVLFLPRDFVPDGLLDGETQQRMFTAVVKAHCTGGPLFIKTHPRDETDYKALFPDAVVLNRFRPAELLDYCFDVRFGRAIGFGTNAVRNLRCADELIDIQDINLADFRTPPPEQEKG